MYFKLTYRISKILVNHLQGVLLLTVTPAAVWRTVFNFGFALWSFLRPSRLFGSSEAAYEIKVIKTSAYSVIELRDLKSISRNHNRIEDIISYSF